MSVIRNSSTISRRALLSSDNSAITGSAALADTGLEARLGVGIWRIEFCLLFKNESNVPGSRTRLSFGGTIALMNSENTRQEDNAAPAPYLSFPGTGTNISTTDLELRPTVATSFMVKHVGVWNVTVAGLLKVRSGPYESTADDFILAAGSYLICEK